MLARPLASTASAALASAALVNTAAVHAVAALAGPVALIYCVSLIPLIFVISPVFVALRVLDPAVVTIRCRAGLLSPPAGETASDPLHSRLTRGIRGTAGTREPRTREPRSRGPPLEEQLVRQLRKGYTYT